MIKALIFSVFTCSLLGFSFMEKPVERQAEINEDINNPVDSRAACFLPIGPFSFEQMAYVGCTSGSGFCSSPFPFPHIPDLQLASNQAYGNASLNEENNLVFDIDGSSLGEEFIQNIINDPVFRVSSNLEIPQDFLDRVYTCEGLSPPSITIPKGDYPVEIEEGTTTIIILIPFAAVIIIHY